MTPLKSKVATKVYHEGAGVRVRYHETDVVTTTPKSILLNTGGWFTSTTKKRMNEASVAFGLGFTVYQEKKAWHVNFNGQVLDFRGDVLELAREGVAV